MMNPAPAESPKNIRVAVIQAGSVLLDNSATLRRLASLTADACRSGAKLVVFPEAFVGGYPKGLDFGVSLGMRTPEGRSLFGKYFECGISIPGPETEVISEIARASRIFLVTGVVERDGGTLYCTALTFGPDGRIAGMHRKLVPTALERVIWGRGDGDAVPVVPTEIGRIGTAICWENYMPLLRTAMYENQVELYCALTVDDRETWISTVRHIAMEGRCFVLSACQVLPRDSLPPQYDTTRFPPDQSFLIRGGSCIVDPLGQIIAGPTYETECVLTADLQYSDLAAAKFDLDVTGHYARPDIFRLLVNGSEQRNQNSLPQSNDPIESEL